MKDLTTPTEKDLDTLVFVKKYLQTKYCDLFQLNNHRIIAKFRDKAEFRIDPKKNLLQYIGTEKVMEEHPISSALNSSNLELTRHLKHVHEVFKWLLDSSKNN
jgi:hypothetical protein